MGVDRYRHPIRRTLDGRTADGRRRKTVLADLVQALGGEDQLSPAQRIIIGQLDLKLAMVDGIRVHIEKQSSLIGADGDLLPSVRRALLGYSNSVNRDIAILYGLRGVSKKKVLDLSSYLREKRSRA